MTKPTEFYRARSKFTLEPMPTIEEILNDMAQLYLKEKGYGDVHDAYKVLLPIDPATIGIKLFSIIEDMNEAKMLENGYCPECSDTLVNVCIPATREDPEENYAQCPSCRDDYRARAC